MDRFSFLNSVHPSVIDSEYERYLKNPDSLEPSWKAFFQGFDFGVDANSEALNSDNEDFTSKISNEKTIKEFKVIELINGYRTRGHLFTKTNPVRNRREYYPTLDISNFGLSEADLQSTFEAGKILSIGPSTLEKIIHHLEKIYCDSTGVEYMYIRNPLIIQWIQNWLNQNDNHPTPTIEDRRRIFNKLNQAVSFENYLHTKFVGQKRFSLEGNETLIPALDKIIEHASNKGVDEFVVGMAHRGRLNVLANIFGKTYEQIFSEFEGIDFDDELFDGDVKYHLGSTTTTKNSSGKEIKMNLAPNPSHLEAVGPVVLGIARAKIEDDHKGDFDKVLPIIIHGDAAIAGQGVVYEVIQMMSLDGYKTGGTIHIVTNNQIGFTTNYIDGRSSTYCTDVGKATLSPVMHVNADDAEAVVHAVTFAVDFRKEYNRDVFIDLLGYRRYGHNEGDEPRFTQPKLYKAISKHPNPREIYKKRLIQKGAADESFIQEQEKHFKALLDKEFDESKQTTENKLEPFMPDEWKNFHLARKKEILQTTDTSFLKEKLEEITKVITTLPENEKFLRKIERLLKQRSEMVKNDQIDWGMAEQLAYGSLLTEDYNIRISGEDVERGTFSHRHAIIKTEEAEKEYTLLNHIPGIKTNLQVYNSHLSEYGVLGFDYGFAMASPNTLTIWEAQFGDFSNGAQIMTDQYISAAEDKWKIQNGLVLYLPHGYEGQGAEHSSARMERFLQMCAKANMIVTDPTTPANFYHMLRRHMLENFRKPLIVFTPKSLLRHPRCISTLEDLSNGKFQEVIDDSLIKDKSEVKKIALCTGKFYYDLLEFREKNNITDTAIIRIEQLYPIHKELLKSILEEYKNVENIYWTQEEPRNMGAWTHMLVHLDFLNLKVVSPEAAAATATGTMKRFKMRHEAVIRTLFEK